MTIDWKLKKSTQAHMRRTVKRVLNRHGYPPDKKDSAIKTVLEQAGLICEEWEEKKEEAKTAVVVLEGQEPRARVFISHEWENREFVLKTADFLRSNGIEVWKGNLSMKGGEDLLDKISEGLQWCDSLLLAWSEEAGKSKWVDRTWKIALKQNKKIIPCLLDDTPLPPFLEILQSLDCKDDPECQTRGKEILKALKKEKTTPTPEEGFEKIVPEEVTSQVAEKVVERSAAKPPRKKGRRTLLPPKEIEKLSKLAELQVIEILENFGFQEAKKIEEENSPGKKMPDIFANDGTDAYLFEVKCKGYSEKIIENIKESIQKGEAFFNVEAIAYKNPMSSIIKNSVAQLSSPAAPEAKFKLLWIFISGKNTPVQADQFEATFYGIYELMDLDTKSSKKCLYYLDSEFYRFKDSLDGVVLGNLDGGMLYLNSFSPSYEALNYSFLAKAFGKGVYDPLREEECGRVYIADCEVPRKERAQTLKYIQQKYGKNRLTEMAVISTESKIFLF